MRSLALLLSVLGVASCASATGEGTDGGPDARVRGDADPGVTSVDAAVFDAAPGQPDAEPIDAAPPDAAPAVEALLITEIVDADLTGGVPKFVELTNLGTVSLDLSEFSLGVFSNGSFTLSGGSSNVLSGTLGAGESFVVSFETGDAPGSSTFRTVYGFDADDLSYNAIINGNDTVVLFRGAATGNGSDAVVEDIYGVIGTNGSGQAWEYLDGFATRRTNISDASPSFVDAEWIFSGPSALDGELAAAIAAATSPGTH